MTGGHEDELLTAVEQIRRRARCAGTPRADCHHLPSFRHGCIRCIPEEGSRILQ